jgi:hypothetical protein
VKEKRNEEEKLKNSNWAMRKRILFIRIFCTYNMNQVDSNQFTLIPLYVLSGDSCIESPTTLYHQSLFNFILRFILNVSYVMKNM